MSPLTPNMHAALDLLASDADRPLVRLWSEWWVREVDQAKAYNLGPALVDVSGRLQASGAFWAAGEEPHVLLGTATVKALAKRGLLKFKGPKRLVLAGGKRKDYHRAELTPAGAATARRARGACPCDVRRGHGQAGQVVMQTAAPPDIKRRRRLRGQSRWLTACA